VAECVYQISSDIDPEIPEILLYEGLSLAQRDFRFKKDFE
jgi:hypothetical protein